MNILILNGPNMNLLGKRETSIYGTTSYEDLCKIINDYACKKSVNVTFIQSNIEGELINHLQATMNNNIDAVIFNAAGYTHTSVALRDCIKAINTKVVEVHMSNILKREIFRHRDLIKGVCVKRIMGKGINSYLEAIDYILENESNFKNK